MPIWVVESNENLDSTMCPRFHVDEFVWSVFQPTLRKNLDFVLNLAKVSIDGVEELLITLEQKKGIEAIDVAERIQKGTISYVLMQLRTASLQYKYRVSRQVLDSLIECDNPIGLWWVWVAYPKTTIPY